MSHGHRYQIPHLLILALARARHINTLSWSPLSLFYQSLPSLQEQKTSRRGLMGVRPPLSPKLHLFIPMYCVFLLSSKKKKRGRNFIMTVPPRLLWISLKNSMAEVHVSILPLKLHKVLSMTVPSAFSGPYLKNTMDYAMCCFFL